MIDKKNKKLKIGDTVLFLINRWSWKGKVLTLNEEKEIATFEVFESGTGVTVGMIERFNFIECNRYIEIISNQ